MEIQIEYHGIRMDRMAIEDDYDYGGLLPTLGTNANNATSLVFVHDIGENVTSLAFTEHVTSPGFVQGIAEDVTSHGFIQDVIFVGFGRG